MKNNAELPITTPLAMLYSDYWNLHESLPRITGRHTCSVSLATELSVCWCLQTCLPLFVVLLLHSITTPAEEMVLQQSNTYCTTAACHCLFLSTRAQLCCLYCAVGAVQLAETARWKQYMFWVLLGYQKRTPCCTCSTPPAVDVQWLKWKWSHSLSSP